MENENVNGKTTTGWWAIECVTCEWKCVSETEAGIQVCPLVVFSNIFNKKYFLRLRHPYGMSFNFSNFSF